MVLRRAIHTRNVRLDARYRRAAAVVLVVCLVTAGVAGTVRSSAAAAPTRTGAHRTPAKTAQAAVLTRRQLAADLLAGTRIMHLPANVTPPLSRATDAYPLILKNGCQLWWDPVRSKPCFYGDTRSRITAVLFGDSHAGAWFPAVNLVSRRNHWRLAIFTKAGCPPPEVTMMHPTPYTACDQWRSNSLWQIAGLHPAVVIVSWARWLKAQASPERGVPLRYGDPWQDGVAAVFGALHRWARQTVFISDVPLMAQGVVTCITHHRSDVRACDTPRSRAVNLPTVRTQELALARQFHIGAIDPIPWFCTSTLCPAIVKNMLLYRDNAHMTPPWSRFIAPVLGAALNRALHNT